jgi:hypothetical protein
MLQEHRKGGAVSGCCVLCALIQGWLILQFVGLIVLGVVLWWMERSGQTE